jgi:hypothetical protein
LYSRQDTKKQSLVRKVYVKKVINSYGKFL